MYVELPLIETSTPADRLQALKDAKVLMSGNEPTGGFGTMFGTKSAPGASRDGIDGFIRLAEYITTGHDYRDTHPEGKRRPIIHQHTINVTPMLMDAEELPDELHDFLHHLMEHDHEDGDGDADAENN